MLHARDAAGNWTWGTVYAYYLAANPGSFSPTGSSSWRPTFGGTWNPIGNSRLYVGYYDTPSWNSVGFWFYGTAFSNWWQAGRTVTSARIYISRFGCGNATQDRIDPHMHHYADRPADAQYQGTPTYDYIGAQIGTVGHGESKWMGFPVGNIMQLMAGTYRGIALANGGKPILLSETPPGPTIRASSKYITWVRKGEICHRR